MSAPTLDTVETPDPAVSVDWMSMPCIAFDLETTHPNPHHARIVQAALVKIVPVGHDADGDPVTDITVRTYLVDPGIPIPDEAAAIHGISTEQAQAGATHTVAGMLEEVTSILANTSRLMWPIVIQNAPYDLTLLEAENHRHRIRSLTSRAAEQGLPVGPIIDPFVLDKHASSRKGSRKLVDLAEHYKVDLTAAHDAGADATAAGLIWRHVIDQNPGKFTGLTTVGALHMAQIGWKDAQASNLRSFWRRIDDPRHREVCGEWPIHADPNCPQRNENLTATTGVNA